MNDTTTPATAPRCRCGHPRNRHTPRPGDTWTGAQCDDCPGDEERSWRHPYTPADTTGSAREILPVLLAADPYIPEVHGDQPGQVSAEGLPDAIADYIGEHCPSEFPTGADKAAELIMAKVVTPLLARVAELEAAMHAEPLATEGAVTQTAHAIRAAEDDSNDWTRCSGLHCPNAERYTKAAERGWEHCGMDAWLCPEHATGNTPGGAA